MKEEKEIKIEVLDKNQSFESVVSLFENLFNVKFGSEQSIKDYYYDTKEDSYFLKNHALRIRDTYKGSSIAYKVLFYVPERESNPWFVLEKEANFPLNKNFLQDLFSIANIKTQENFSEEISPEQVKGIFKKSGLDERIILDKVRRLVHINDNLEIAIDFVKNLGVFVEFELINNDNNIDTYNLQDILKKIPFEYQEIRFGYTNLYAERVLGINIPDFKKIYSENPNWNYLSGQKEEVNKLLFD